MSPDERAIRDLVDTWTKASRAGDTETVLSLMSDDVVFMIPGREPFGTEQWSKARNCRPDQLACGSMPKQIAVLGGWPVR